MHAKIRKIAIGLALILAAVTGSDSFAADIAAPLGSETILYNFGATPTDGIGPLGPLVQDSSGALYGVTANDGNFDACGGDVFPLGCGYIFKLSPPAPGQTSWTQTVLKEFPGGAGLCTVCWVQYPNGGLVMDQKGALFGTTGAGGAALRGFDQFGEGIAYELRPPTGAHTQWEFITLHNFSGINGDGANPQAPLIAGPSGVFFGTTRSGGSFCLDNSGCGTVFELTPPSASQNAWSEIVLYRFKGFRSSGFSDGESPSTLLIDNSGALYGVTLAGGTANKGVIYKLTPPISGGTLWSETVLYRFTGVIGGKGVDGAYPNGPLIIDGNGALYGTTQAGGSGECPATDFVGVGCGTVFKLTPPPPGGTKWSEEILYSFREIDGDGGNPSGLVFGPGGVLYGTTANGGSNIGVCQGLQVAGFCVNTAGDGTVFKLTPPAPGQNTWAESILWRFQRGSDTTDGANPISPSGLGGGFTVSNDLIVGANGALIGTAASGGNGPCVPANGVLPALGCGTVFSIAP